MSITIKSATELPVTHVTYDIEVDGVSYVYIEIIDNRKRLIDAELKDIHGYMTEDVALLEQVQAYIDNLPS